MLTSLWLRLACFEFFRLEFRELPPSVDTHIFLVFVHRGGRPGAPQHFALFQISVAILSDGGDNVDGTASAISEDIGVAWSVVNHCNGRPMDEKVPNSKIVFRLLSPNVNMLRNAVNSSSSVERPRGLLPEPGLWPCASASVVFFASVERFPASVARSR